jgi:hypothetical protein
MENCKFSIKTEKKINNFIVHYSTNNELWGSRDQNLYRIENQFKKITKIKISKSLKSNLFGKSKFIKRILKLCINNFLLLDSSTVLFIHDAKIYRYVIGTGYASIVYHLKHGTRPLKMGFTKDSNGFVYLGEYWSNKKRKEVSIIKGSQDGKNWYPVYTFPKGSIRHIHAVQHDPYTNSIWVTTGDKTVGKDTETLIALSEDGGRNFTTIGKGNYKWKTISLIFTEDYVYWGTDDPFRHNYIYQWNRSNGNLKRLAFVKGPVYYSKKVGDYILFSTAVEKGSCDQDYYARIYGLDKNLNCFELHRLKKDNLNPFLFGYGIFEFARGKMEGNKFWINTKGLVGGQMSILFAIED